VIAYDQRGGDGYMSPEHFEAYVRSLSKPGALRACIEHYAQVWDDARDNAVIHESFWPCPRWLWGRGVIGSGGRAGVARRRDESDHQSDSEGGPLAQ
jgi:hypothetical protein